ncbi:hypothetical protein BH23BAC3_BH23BAC3_33270 [soil metagenome]
MINHIYGRRDSLVPENRPHMFAKEMIMYVDYLEEMMQQVDPNDTGFRKLVKMRKNLEIGMELCVEISEMKAYDGENLNSLKETVVLQAERLNHLFAVCEIEKD